MNPNICSDEAPRMGLSPCDPHGFHRELSAVLNRHGIDNLLSTPDHVLATMLIEHLDSFGNANASAKRLAKGGPDIQIGDYRDLIELPPNIQP